MVAMKTEAREPQWYWGYTKVAHCPRCGAFAQKAGFFYKPAEYPRSSWNSLDGGSGKPQPGSTIVCRNHGLFQMSHDGRWIQRLPVFPTEQEFAENHERVREAVMNPWQRFWYKVAQAFR